MNNFMSDNYASKITVLPGANGNAYSASKRLYHMIHVDHSNLNKNLTEGFLLERVVDELDVDKGGVIVLSTDVNAKKLDDNKFFNWIKKKLKTVENRINFNKKIDKVANEKGLLGWTIGKFLNGRYFSKNGTLFSENSLSVEIVGINTGTLIDIATELCGDFEQETVLVKDYETGHIYFVDEEIDLNQ